MFVAPMDPVIALASWLLPVLIGAALGAIFVIAFFWDNRESWSPELRRAFRIDQSPAGDSEASSPEPSSAGDGSYARAIGRSVLLGFGIATGGVALGMLVGILTGSVWAAALISWLVVFAVVVWLQRAQRASR